MFPPARVSPVAEETKRSCTIVSLTSVKYFTRSADHILTPGQLGGEGGGRPQRSSAWLPSFSQGRFEPNHQGPSGDRSVCSARNGTRWPPLPVRAEDDQDEEPVIKRDKGRSRPSLSPQNPRCLFFTDSFTYQHSVFVSSPWSVSSSTPALPRNFHPPSLPTALASYY